MRVRGYEKRERGERESGKLNSKQKYKFYTYRSVNASAIQANLKKSSTTHKHIELINLCK